MANENREFKDSVFCDLFYNDTNAKKNLLELYNALFGTQYTDPEVIQLVRLEDVLFKNLKNDVAFTVLGQSIVLSEHQSTINPNMPLRDLMYIAREYERIVPVKQRYQKKLIKIPTPVFYTFYNGKEDYPVEQELLLSNAFMNSQNPVLELKVKIININPDKKHELLSKCAILKEYSEFIEITRKHKQNKNTLENAIHECIQRNILADYLKRKSSEVVNMLMAEYDYEMDMAVQKEEAKEELREEVIKEVRAEIQEEVRAEIQEEVRAEIQEEVRAEIQEEVRAEIQKEVWKEASQHEQLKYLICKLTKKLKKNYSAEQIADALEESLETIQAFVNIAIKYAPEYNEDMILNEIINQEGKTPK